MSPHLFWLQVWPDFQPQTLKRVIRTTSLRHNKARHVINSELLLILPEKSLRRIFKIVVVQRMKSCHDVEKRNLKRAQDINNMVAPYWQKAIKPRLEERLW